MSTFRIGRTEHVTLGNDGIDSKVDAFIRDLRSEADPLEAITDALRDTLIYFAEADIEVEDAKRDEDAAASDAVDGELTELRKKVEELEAERDEKSQKLINALVERDQAMNTLHCLEGSRPVNIDAILNDNPNVVRATFGDNKMRAYKLCCEASQVDEQDPHEGARLYQRALALDPKLALAWTNLGNCMHQLDRSQRALECFRRAIEIEPRQAEGHYNIATLLLLESTADNREVELQLKLAIDCDPKFSDAYYTLGAMYVRKADAKNAKLYLEQFLKLAPKSIYADDVKKMLRGER